MRGYFCHASAKPLGERIGSFFVGERLDFQCLRIRPRHHGNPAGPQELKPFLPGVLPLLRA